MRQAAAGALVLVTILIGGCANPDDAMRAAIRDHVLRSSPTLAAATGEGFQRPASRTDAVDDPTSWMAWTAAFSDGVATTQPAAPDAPQPTAPSWRDRRGPAYPDDFTRSFGRWAAEFAPIVWDDTVATATNTWTWIGLGAAGASGIAIAASEADHKVADHYARRGPQLSHFWDMVGDIGGNPGTHFGLAGGMLLWSMAYNDVEMYEKSNTLASALAINGVVTMALKGLVRSRSPNSDPWGWPSGHTSSTFALATVLHKQYGSMVGVPMFAFAAFVGYERIDARNHDFSDVISGAIIGIVIGHAVTENHNAKILGMDIVPYVGPRGGVGIALSKKW
jgi:membrane-associated phospholipid phosphatase